MPAYGPTIKIFENSCCKVLALTDNPLMKHEIRSMKFISETNSTRVVACPENATASASTERTIHHAPDADEQDREVEIEAWVASLK